jgi:polyvinyl alcohol dehydrogenase (cytochrome)
LLGNIVGIGQKSGYYYAFDANTGKSVWTTVVGPGGPLGGVLWGTASDGVRMYVAIANSNHVAWKLLPSGKTVTWGFWSALDRTTGKILWQTSEPTSGTLAISSISVANGVLYVGSFDQAGQMYAVNAATGQVLWIFTSGGSVLDAPSIVDGTLYWGSGYKRFGIGIGNNKLYAFGLQ